VKAKAPTKRQRAIFHIRSAAKSARKAAAVIKSMPLQWAQEISQELKDLAGAIEFMEVRIEDDA
jgi:hypothetical protein